MNKNKRYLITLIIAGLLFLTALGFALTFLLTKTVIKHYNAALISIILMPITGIIVFFALNRFIANYASYRALLAENFYNLGVKSAFYGLPAFRARVGLMTKDFRLKKKKQFLIAFTASNLSIMQNTNRDESISYFNAKIANYLEKEFLNKHGKKNMVFCFNFGLFLMFAFADEEKFIKDAVADISQELFRLSEDKSINVWVQPFFGVYEVEKGIPLIESIENAQIARTVSERNFESVTYYHESFRRRSSKEEIIEITEAMENEEFVVYYQPKYNLNTKRFISSEALIRWDSKKYGLLPPNKFIPLVEAAGLIHEIDTYVFRKVCEDLNEAKRKGRRIIPVSINFSIYEFYSPEFLNSIMSLLDQYKINPSYIEIEITEATSRANTFVSVSIIKKLRERGVRVLMDDFGVGFSNIGNLRKIPFDAVKIDKSFIDDIVTDPKSRAIVKFLIELCPANGMEVIAEGVDNKEQVAILKQYKCNTIQGFYYSQALPVKEYEKFLVNNPFERKENK